MQSLVRFNLQILAILAALFCGPANAQPAATDPNALLRQERIWAEQGSDIFQTKLGVRYRSGDGVEKSYEEAVKWFRLAADQGNPNAAALLAGHYFSGLGVAEDWVQAYMWHEIAILRSEPTDRVRATEIKARDSLGKTMTEGQIKEAKRLASEWKPFAKPK